MKKFILIATLLAVLLTACGKREVAPDAQTSLDNLSEKSNRVPSYDGAALYRERQVERFIDKEAQVLCYLQGGAVGGSLSLACVPLSRTTMTLDGVPRQ